MKRTRRPRPPVRMASGFAGFRFPPEVILLAVRWYLRYGLKTHRTASVVIRGHAFIQNLRRGHYELALDAAPAFRLATAFDELRFAV
jgi:hypothetical protein